MTDPGAGDRPGDEDDEGLPEDDRFDQGGSVGDEPAAADESPDSEPHVQVSDHWDAGEEPTTGMEPNPEEIGYVEWLRTTDEPSIVILRDVVSSVGTVVLIGILLFAASGLWPPLVAVESGSMEPHMHRGDLVFVMEEQRFAPDQSVEGTGVVTVDNAREVDRTDENAQGYRSFGDYGNVIVYERNGRAASPIIHRAHLYVEEDERWVSRADEDHLAQGATCGTVDACPAPHDGFVTKGDANDRYDQAGAQTQQISTVVKPDWVRGRAKARIPFLGHVRLLLGTIGSSPAPAGGAGLGGGAVVPLSARLFAVCSVGVAAAFGTRR